MKLKITDAYVTEGKLYAPRNSEDNCLVVCDYGVGVDVEVGGEVKRYTHDTFCKKGWHMGEEFATVDRRAKVEAEAFARKVREKGVIDLTYWTEEKPFDLRAELDAEAEREQWERMYGEV